MMIARSVCTSCRKKLSTINGKFRQLLKVSMLDNRSGLIQRRNFGRALYDPENKGERQKHVNFDTLGTWDNRIELPLLLQQSIKHGKPIPKISIENVGYATLIGRRTYNEDRFRLEELLPDVLYFAVFDGHGGSECADFCSAHLQDHLLFWLKKGEKDLQTILQISFIELNNAFARHMTFKSPNGNGMMSGTTATVCLLRNSVELVIGHSGDSRAVLCRNGEARRLTMDHAPVLKVEKDRIVQSGGIVVTDSYGRSLVNGRLAMTRSLGDLDLKPYGVTALPDTRSLEVKHGKDAFLILTTDGINSVMPDQEICDIVGQYHDPQEAAHFITDQALQFASEDNTTAIVVPFGSWGKYSNSSNTYNYCRSMIRSCRYF